MTETIDEHPADDTELAALASAVGPEDRARLLDLTAAANDDRTVLDELVKGLYAAGLVTNRFDWVAWWATAPYRADTDVSEATVADAVRLITTFVRGDRFNEGLLDQAVRRGVFPAAVRRALA